MSLEGAYDPNNIFARILRGEAPKVLIAEDESTLAFMDVFPQSRGHCLVIHRTSQARNLLEADPQVVCEVFAAARRLARAVRTALRPDGIVVTQFNGAAAGQTVFHLHVHVIPRWEGQPLGRHAAGAMADPAELAVIAQEIAGALEA